MQSGEGLSRIRREVVASPENVCRCRCSLICGILIPPLVFPDRLCGKRSLTATVQFMIRSPNKIIQHAILARCMTKCDDPWESVVPRVNISVETAQQNTRTQMRKYSSGLVQYINEAAKLSSLIQVELRPIQMRRRS